MKSFYILLGSAVNLYLFLLGVAPLQAGVTLEAENGDMMLYHKIVLTVDELNRTEDEATFKDCRMTVDFVHQSGKTFTISGYFAADGDAANTSATSGNKWRCNFRPDEAGIWDYTINFRSGTDIALKVNSDTSGSIAISPDGTTGSFTIYHSDKTSRDFRNPERGPLKYVGKHLLKYSGSDNYFVRAGMGVPEAIFAYDDFDNTPNAKSWSSHAAHYALNPSPELLWQGNKGKNLMGAANYTIQQGANTLYGVMFNVPGDGGDSRFPWVSTTDKTTFDVSKLEQWDRILTHFNNVGVAFVFLFGEVENETVLNLTQRKLFYREAAARFGHLSAITFVLSEEMESTSIADANAWCNFLKGVDGHDSQIGIHTRGNAASHTEYYEPLANYSSTNYACIQTRDPNYSDVYSETRRIRAMSDGAGQTPWLCCPDEARIAGTTSLNTDSSDPNHDSERINALWGSLMAGGMGASMYSTVNGGDVNMVSFIEFQKFLNQCGAAINFFWDYNIPLGDMAPNDALVANGHCIAAEGIAYVAQLPNGGTTSLNLSGQSGSFNVRWFNTKTGDVLTGTLPTVTGGGTRSLGNAPDGYPTDKVILVTRGAPLTNYSLTTTSVNGYTTLRPSGGTYNEGTMVNLTADADLGFKFDHWEGDLSGTANPETIIMHADKNVIAIFDPVPTYKLSVSAANGTVNLNPKGPEYNADTEVTITAVADSGYEFSGWTGALISSANPETITMDASKSVKANFIESTNLIKNGNFSNGTANWAVVLTESSVDANFSIESGEAFIEIIVDDGTNWHISLEQGGIHLIYGHQYTLSFDATAQADRDIILNCQSDGGSGGLSFENQLKTITSTASTVTHTWTNNSSTKVYKIQIFLGAEGNNNVWFDNFTLIDISSITDVRAINEEKTVLLQISPNPFNTITNVSYLLTEQGHVSLRVYNICGQHVATLFDGYQTEGLHSQTWDAMDSNGRSVENGNYFFCFESGNILKTIKLMLM